VEIGVTTDAGLELAQTCLEPEARRDATTLTPDTRLRLAPGLRTRFDAAGRVLVESPDGRMNGSYRLVVEDSPHPADLALLEERVAAAAVEAAAAGTEKELAVFVRDDDGRILAGVSGIVWGGYCELQAMWVDEAHRGRGLARALMAAAEEEARRRGCALVAFHAYDLLAAGLYERLGYETVGVIEGIPAGSAARWYRKDL
jgi:GNAT superfamily N-acetyltransferase